MNISYKHVIPSIAVLAMTASVALAQMPPGPRGDRAAPTAEQIAQHRGQMCADHEARGDARLTYIEERLNLTAAQKPLFERWKTAVQSENAAHQAQCIKPRPMADHRPTLPERNARMEEMLKARLASLEQMRPAEEALYNALTAEQKQLFDRGGRGGSRMAMRGPHGRDFGGRDFGRRFGRGPDGPPPRDGN